MSHKHDPKKIVLDDYEKDLEANLDKSEPLSGDEREEAERLLKVAAENYYKNKRISIRIFDKDLERLRVIANREGLPYQTLITSVLHKFVTGQLVHRSRDY